MKQATKKKKRSPRPQSSLEQRRRALETLDEHLWQAERREAYVRFVVMWLVINFILTPHYFLNLCAGLAQLFQPLVPFPPLPRYVPFSGGISWVLNPTNNATLGFAWKWPEVVAPPVLPGNL